MQDCLHACRKCVLHVILGNERLCSLSQFYLIVLLDKAPFYLILSHGAINITRRLLKPGASFIGRLSTLLACTCCDSVSAAGHLGCIHLTLPSTYSLLMDRFQRLLGSAAGFGQVHAFDDRLFIAFSISKTMGP